MFSRAYGTNFLTGLSYILLYPTMTARIREGPEFIDMEISLVKVCSYGQRLEAVLRFLDF